MRWNFLLFTLVFHYRKICKSGLKPCYLLNSRGQNMKNITKIEQKGLFLFTFLVSFFHVFSHAKADLHNKYMI